MWIKQTRKKFNKNKIECRFNTFCRIDWLYPRQNGKTPPPLHVLSMTLLINLSTYNLCPLHTVHYIRTSEDLILLGANHERRRPGNRSGLPVEQIWYCETRNLQWRLLALFSTIFNYVWYPIFSSRFSLFIVNVISFRLVQVLWHINHGRFFNTNFQTIQFSISTVFISIWTFEKTLSGPITPSQSESGSDGNKGVLRIPQSSSITEASPSDCLVSCRWWDLTPLQRCCRYILQL